MLETRKIIFSDRHSSSFHRDCGTFIASSPSHPLVPTGRVTADIDELQRGGLGRLLCEKHDTLLVAAICASKFFGPLQRWVLMDVGQNRLQPRRQILNNLVSKHATALNVLHGICARVRLADIFQLALELVFLGVQQVVADSTKAHHL